MRILLSLLALLTLSACTSTPLPHRITISGRPEIKEALERQLTQPEQGAIYHIHVKEKMTLERLNPLDLSTLHTAYQLHDQVILTWNPVPKEREKTVEFNETTWLDIGPESSVNISPQVRHAKERLRSELAANIAAYLH